LLTGVTSLAASIDKSTEEILWAMSAEDTSIFNTEKKKVNHVLAHFPARN